MVFFFLAWNVSAGNGTSIDYDRREACEGTGTRLRLPLLPSPLPRLHQGGEEKTQTFKIKIENNR